LRRIRLTSEHPAPTHSRPPLQPPKQLFLESLSLSRSVWIVEQRRGGNKARGSIEKKNLEKTLANSSQLLVRVIDLIDPWYDCRSPKF
jgi:hypothetical protein